MTGETVAYVRLAGVWYTRSRLPLIGASVGQFRPLGSVAPGGSSAATDAVLRPLGRSAGAGTPVLVGSACRRVEGLGVAAVRVATGAAEADCVAGNGLGSRFRLV